MSDIIVMGTCPRVLPLSATFSQQLLQGPGLLIKGGSDVQQTQ